jgi:SAM-dependent methyltransferase
VTLQGLKPLLATAGCVLDAAPQAQIGKVVSRLAPGVRYIRTDLFDLRRADVCADGVELPFRNESFDLVLHFHVFEHIPADRAAMAEVARVLRPGALMVCQVPVRRGQPTDENFTLSPEENKIRFGQDDHVRWYGDDFEDRLRESGLTVISYTAGETLSAADLVRFNIPPSNRLWFCRSATASLNGEASRAEVSRLLRDLDDARVRYDRLRSRKVVRAGLAAAQVARPAIVALRRSPDETDNE